MWAWEDVMSLIHGLAGTLGSTACGVNNLEEVLDQ